ncbi:peroxidasin homolog [Limulus polyphemus]|uniref:Peroxidasin homolog n=1 Tax=Limulus polyphemus TaxID=6850 RepID=A0ABM1BDG6_LIMPO|nr:peroxidasin homolog [Limulus polyphemus]
MDHLGIVTHCDQEKRYELYLTLLVVFSWNSVLSQLNSVYNGVSTFDRDYGSKSNECALIFKRTSGNLLGRTPARTYDGFLNFLKPGPFRSTDLVEDTCIRYIDVNRALAEAKRQRGYTQPSTINSLEPLPPHIDKTAELVLTTTRILARQFQLSPDEIVNGLPMIDTSRTDIWEVCPAHVKPMPCTTERYRTYTGVCNNVHHTSWGSTHTPFVRQLPPVYKDGISEPRVSVVDGSPLPPARMVSAYIHRDYDYPSSDLSVLLMSWGQFIDHDMTLAAPPRVDENDLDFVCCGIPKEQQHPNCMTIDIPPADPFYTHYGQTCMEFKRVLAGHRPGCTLGPRVHINLLTQALDANFLYGSTEKLAKELRLGRGGLMRVWDYFSDYGLKPLLPPLSSTPEKDCTARPKHLFCFNGGDERANEQIHLTVLHTMYLRDHNRLATELSRLNPHWDDNKIYHETRHIMAAALQHITYYEFLPMVLGQDMMSRYNLTLKTHGYWNGYDPDVHMGMSNSFQSAAFRFGHTFIQGMIRRYNKHPDDIDLWSGGISERRLQGSLIGPTFACIIARQFTNAKKGDRFWYENSGFPSAFTLEQLQEIRKSNQAKILCENADDLPTIQLYVMRLSHPIYNPRMRCEDIPSIDLRFWQEDPIQGGYPFKK